MEIITTVISWIINFLSLPLPAGGFFVVVAILATWLVNRSRFKSAQAKARELDREIESLTQNLDINRKIHEKGERALMENNSKLQEELEDLRSEIRILKEKPSRREWARLKRCEEVVKQFALTSPDDGLEVENLLQQARVELVECPIEDCSDSATRPSFFRRLLPVKR
jgi:Flp pilus assembly protein TadB